MICAVSESATSLHGAIDADASDTRKVRLLVFTSLYPNVAQPIRGLFIEERLRHLVESGRIEATVVAPVPWFPFRHRLFGRYAALAGVPVREHRCGINVHHPRYPVIPKFGMRIAPLLMFHALQAYFRRLQADGQGFDLIDAHYFYPDGVTAVRLGEVMDKPVVISARGSDITVLPRYRGPRRQIQWAAGRAAAAITVSRALKDELLALGVSDDKITVLRNGADLDRFGLRDRDAIRARLGLSGPVWLTVGFLIELKGVHLAIEALTRDPRVTLLIVGKGPEKPRLHRLAERLGVDARVRFIGAIPHAQLCDYYNAADALIQGSSREGMPNVVLESLACGTPVIAAPFASAWEVIAVPEAGLVAQSRTTDGIFAAWEALQQRSPARDATRRYAATQLSWSATIEQQLALYTKVVGDWRSGMRSGPNT
ncbi:MAG: glycosyltransferase family 4 protein [Rhodanobacteraceae bacterium]